MIATCRSHLKEEIMNFLKSTALIACLLAGGAQAATITENSDFGDFGSPTPLGVLEIGSNSISGSLATTCTPTIETFADCSSGDEIDSLSFSLPSGFEITNLVLKITNFVTTDTNLTEQLGFGNLGFIGFEANGIFPISDIANALLSSRFTFEAASGSVLTNDPNAPLLQGVGDISFDYSASFDVTEVSLAAVPLPAGLPLLLSGLIGLAVLARRRKSS